MELSKLSIAWLIVWYISTTYGLRSGPMTQLFTSSCARHLREMTDDDVKTLDSLLPPTSFLDNLKTHMGKHLKPTVLLLEVDQGTHLLALNHIECLKLSNASVTPFIVAYEEGVCEMMHLNGTGGCFYDKEWSDKLVAFYNSVPDTRSQFIHGYRTMLGRMMTTVVTLCAGYNAFLSDADIVYYRDPVDFVLRDADIMITSTFIADNINHRNYGGYFYATHPKEYSTMNNGVVLFKSTDVVRNLHITMATESLKGLTAVGDPSNGFLQVDFNKYMTKHHLSLRPCRLARSLASTYICIILYFSTLFYI